MTERRVVIVGGGITGLAAAYHLVTRGGAVRVTLLEKSSRLGGCVYTERSSGFIMEHGADVFLARGSGVVELCQSLGLAIQDPLQRRAYVRHADGLHPLPEGFSGLIPSRIQGVLGSRLLSPWGKARFLAERLVPRYAGQQEESIEAFFRRRYGNPCYTRVVEPLMGGLSGGDPGQLSLDAQLPHLRDQEMRYGSLLRAGTRARSVAPRSALQSLAGGMSSLVEALRSSLGETSVEKEAAVRAVYKRDGGFAIEADRQRTWQADAVLVAAPAYAAAPMLAPVDGALAQLLSSITYGATIVVHLAYRTEHVRHALDASGYVVAPKTQSQAMACTWSSAKLPGRAPVGHVLLRVFFGRSPSDNVFAMDEDELTTLAREEVQSVLGATGKPVLQQAHRWHHSLPRYYLGHTGRVERIQARCRAHPGLYVAGAAYRGAGIAACVQDAQRAAHAILEDLKLNHVRTI